MLLCGIGWERAWDEFKQAVEGAPLQTDDAPSRPNGLAEPRSMCNEIKKTELFSNA